MPPIQKSVLHAFGVTDKGSVRPANQDCFAIQQELGLIVVADGMGGAQAGDLAARIAVDAIVEYFAHPSDGWPFGFDPALSPDGNRLRTAILIASVQILETAITTDRCAGMGTTVVAARVAEGRLIVAHVGDSRLYWLSGGSLRQLTTDDAWMGALTNVVGARGGTTVHVAEQPIEAGDALLLTTDGVHEVLDERRMTQLMMRAHAPRTTAEHIVATALARGTRDNCTAVVAHYHQ